MKTDRLVSPFFRLTQELKDIIIERNGVDDKLRKQICGDCIDVFGYTYRCGQPCRCTLVDAKNWWQEYCNVKKEEKPKYKFQCWICGKEFESVRRGVKYCSKSCRITAIKYNVKRIRSKKKMDRISDFFPSDLRHCVFCEHNLVLNVHSEIVDNIRYVFLLCPNHYTLIKLGIKSFLDLLKEYNYQSLPYKIEEKSLNFLQRYCQYCKKEMGLDIHGNQKFCSDLCRERFGKEKKIQIFPQEWRRCLFCGYNLVMDIHSERINGQIYDFILCPTHHALITHGIKTFQELLREYNIQKLPYFERIKK